MEIPSDIPVYAFIKRELKNQIEGGELCEGARVPSELELARQYGVSRNPTRQALRDLELEGYIVRAPGRGSFVAPAAQYQRVLQLPGWHTVAIACPELECGYPRSVVRGFIQYAAERGFHAMVYFLRFSNESEFEFLADLRNSGVEGIAFWLQHASERTLELLRKFQRSKFPFVLIDRYVRGLDADYVVTHNIDVASRLTAALVRRGHQNVGYITTRLDNTTAEDRYTGYRRALKEHGLPLHEEQVGMIDKNGEPVDQVLSRIMALRERPTAFFCINDGAAEKLIETLTGLGYSIPGDLEIAAVDDNDVADTLGVPMYTARQAGHAMGCTGAEILLERIADPDKSTKRCQLEAVLNFDEESCAIVKKGGVLAGR